MQIFNFNKIILNNKFYQIDFLEFILQNKFLKRANWNRLKKKVIKNEIFSIVRNKIPIPIKLYD